MCHHLFTLMSLQTCTTFFLLWKIKEEVPRNVSVFVHTMEDNGNQNGLITNILQNIFFCILQKKLSHIDLELRKDKWQNFYFWVLWFHITLNIKEDVSKNGSVVLVHTFEVLQNIFIRMSKQWHNFTLVIWLTFKVIVTQ